MKKALFILSILLFFSCDKAKESTQDAITNSLEKVVENQAGQTIDFPDAESYTENEAYVSFKVEDDFYIKSDEKLTAMALFQKDNTGIGISFQLSSENGKSLIATVTHLKEGFSLPITAKFSKNNAFDGQNPVATVLFMNVENNSVSSGSIPYQGTFTISKLTANEILFEINAKGGQASEVDNPESWKSIHIKGKLLKPITQSLGIDKNKILK
jgi:hypothetical protein